MTFRYSALCIVLGLAAMGCSKSPSSPSGTVTVTAPTPTSPANGALITNASQPITLTIANGTVSDTSASVTYTFEVATDSAFTNKVVTKDVAQTASQTILTLSTLGAGQDYYWHVRTSSGSTIGTFTAAMKFTIGSASTINAPTPTSPTNGTVTISWPTFTVSDATHTGSVGTLAYKFEFSTSSSFSSILLSGTVTETPTQTSFTPAGQTVPSQKTQYFWRVTVSDSTSGVSSTATATQNFFIDVAQTQQAKLAFQQGAVLWPGVQPSGTNGHANMGDNWQLQTLTSHGGITFINPTLAELRVFDLIDRGLSASDAVDWMHANGYPDAGAYYNVGVDVVGFDYTYMAYDPDANDWNIVLRSE